MNTERIEMFDFFIEDEWEGEISIIARNKTTGEYKDVGEICYNCEYCHSALFTQEEAKKIALMICERLKIEANK